MKRRTVLRLAAATLALPGWARSQARKVYRLGWLSTADEESKKRSLEEAFLPGMRALGYAVGGNLVVDVRYARGDVSRYPALSDELIALRPDVLLGNGDACRAMAKKTSRIPIVLTGSLDPVAQGLVKSLARPGTNVTGVSSQIGTLIAKQIELLVEIVPKLSRIALLNDASFADRNLYVRVARETARAKGLTLSVIETAPTPEAIGTAFAKIEQERAQGVVVGGTGPFFGARRALAGESARLRVPAIYNIAGFVEIGGLISYGANIGESLRTEVPPIVDRILKGANPAEMPVQQSAKFEMAINLKTAKEIGVTIPQTVLFRADRVIE